ncbi:hypothetical protein Tco_0661226 [Tanacetum coccineum]
MKPRPEPRKEATPTLQLRSPMVCRQQERVVGFEDAPNKEGNKRGSQMRKVFDFRRQRLKLREGKKYRDGATSLRTNIGGNLHPNGTLLSHHVQPFIPNSFHIPTGLVPIPVNPYSQPSVNLIIYERCFEKLNPTIKATKVDQKTPLVGFSRECSWSIGEVPLEITIGDAPLSRTETLNFVIVRSDSTHNMLLGRTSMQMMGIVVLKIHGAIKFHTKKGIGAVLLADEADEGTKRARKIPATNEERVLSCVNVEEKIIVNDKYPDQTVTIGKQLPEHFKKELQNLLKSKAGIFAWTHADMTGIPRTIMVEGT